jgi:hypothetical protein
VTLTIVCPLIVTVLFGRTCPLMTSTTLTRVIASERTCDVTETVAVTVAATKSTQSANLARDG